MSSRSEALRLGVRTFLRSGLGHGEFRRGIGFQPFIRYDSTAADGAAVRAVVDSLQRSIECRQPIAKPGSDGIVDALFAQRLRRIGDVARFPLGCTVIDLLGADVAEQSLHLRTLRGEQRPGSLEIHLINLIPERLTPRGARVVSVRSL